MAQTGASRGFSRPLALVVAVAAFMEFLDGTIIQTAAPAMAHDFDVRPADINIAMAAYLLAVAVGIPISGWLADRFGVRPMFLVAIGVFTAASVLCAYSPSLPLLVVARVVQGLGGAMMVPVGRLAVLRDVSPRELLNATAYLVWPALVAPVVAPAIGGFITDSVGWPWVFLVNVPIGAAVFVAALAIVPRGEGPHRVPLDWTDFVLVALGLLFVTAGAEMLTDGGAEAWAIAIPPVVGGVALIAWAWSRMRRVQHPLFDPHSMRIRTFRTSNVSGGLYRLVVWSVPFLVTLLFQVGFGWTAAQAGLVVIALFVGNIAIKPATTPIIRALGFRATLVWSGVSGAAVVAAFVFVDAATPVWVDAALLLVSGALRSIGFSAYATLQFVDVPPELKSSANTLSSTMQQTAIALGVAVVAVFVHASVAAAEAAGVPGSLGYRWAFLPAAVLHLVPAIGAWLLPHDAGAHATARD